MFCQKCGANNNDGSKFCEKCGAPLEAPAAGPAQGAGPGYGPAPGYIPYVPKKVKTAAVANSVAGIISDIKTADKKLMTKAIAVVLMIVTALSMMVGVAKDEFKGGSKGKDDRVETYTVFQMARNSLYTAADIADTKAADFAYQYDAEKGDKKDAEFNFNMAAFFNTTAAVLVGLAMFAFALTFFLMAIKSKNAAFVAQVACILATAGILFAIIATTIFYSGGQKVCNVDSDNRVKFAWGAIVALAAAVGSFFYIGMNKKDIVD